MFSLKIYMYVFLGKCDYILVGRQSLKSYKSQNVLIKYRRRFEQQEKKSFKTSDGSHMYWKKECIII